MQIQALHPFRLFIERDFRRKKRSDPLTDILYFQIEEGIALPGKELLQDRRDLCMMSQDRTFHVSIIPLSAAPAGRKRRQEAIG